MKGVVVILDGMGDLPDEALGGKTPLESANMPNLDFLATRGEMGYMYPVKPGFIPESDEALVSLFGNELISSTRGQLEARGAGVNTIHGDLALRANFATIDSLESGNIIDRRAGRTLTSAEAEALAKAVNRISLPCSFVFRPTLQHRGVVVLRGGFSDNISENDPTYLGGQAKFSDRIISIKPLDDEDNSQYSAGIVNKFLEKSFEVLDKHPVNEERRRKGLLPANYLLVRGPGIDIPKLKLYSRWLSIAYTPLEKGFSQLSGMKAFSFEYPRMKSLDSYEHLKQGLGKACRFSARVLRRQKRNFEYAYIHIKEPDSLGHDGKPSEKREALEYIDRILFRFLKDFATQNNIKVIVTADHSTPCQLRNHSADPVPVLLFNNSIPKIEKKYSFSGSEGGNFKVEGKKFCEREARIGSLGRIESSQLLPKLGFVK